MAYAPREYLALRHARLRSALEAGSLDGVVLTHLPNIFYLTNFTGSAAMVVLTASRLFFITDSRYLAEVDASRDAPSGCPDLTLVPVDDSYDQTFVRVVAEAGVERLGFEWAHVPVSRHHWWLASFEHAALARGCRLVATERLVERLRRRKDPHEIDTLRQAGRRLGDAWPGILAELRPGRRERDVAWAVERAVRAAGFDRIAFETIVASGPNAALPHARPGDRLLAAGELILVDFGGVFDGYCVDLTRTLTLGTPDAERQRALRAVAEAHCAAIASVRPGVKGSEIDAAARDTLARHGLAGAFGHSTGHGLGIEVHEEPRIGRPRAGGGAEAGAEDAAIEPAPADDDIEAGMVFTIEPGVYLPGRFGVRLEDDVLVTTEGCEVLTGVPRDPMRM